MRSKKTMIFILVLLLLCLIATIFMPREAKAEELGVQAVQGNKLDVAFIQAWLDKYVMPLALGVVTTLGTVIAVFNRIKKIIELNKKDKEDSSNRTQAELDRLKAERQEEFELLKGENLALVSAFKGLKEDVKNLIESLPIKNIEEYMKVNTTDTSVTAGAVLKVDKVLQPLLDMVRIQCESSTLPQDAKVAIKAKYIEAQKLMAEKELSPEFQNLKESIANANRIKNDLEVQNILTEFKGLLSQSKEV